MRWDGKYKIVKSEGEEIQENDKILWINKIGIVSFAVRKNYIVILDMLEWSYRFQTLNKKNCNRFRKGSNSIKHFKHVYFYVFRYRFLHDVIILLFWFLIRVID